MVRVRSEIRLAERGRGKMSALHSLGRFLACFAFAMCVLMAQDATVTGLVTDSASALMPGVVIKIPNTDTNIVRSAQTNNEGSYTVTNLPPGPYELTAEKPGFSAYRQSEIILQVDQVLRANLQLAIGNVNETVHVTAEVAPLNTEN